MTTVKLALKNGYRLYWDIIHSKVVLVNPKLTIVQNDNNAVILNNDGFGTKIGNYNPDFTFGNYGENPVRLIPDSVTILEPEVDNDLGKIFLLETVIHLQQTISLVGDA